MTDILTDAITIPYKNLTLDGILQVPEKAIGLVIFAHGSGSSRFSPRNQAIAKVLGNLNFATLLFDLLTSDEDSIDEQTREYRFNIPLLAERLLAVTEWTTKNSALAALPIGYFGASTGGGAALLAAASQMKQVKAIVSRGGRPDLAGAALLKVEAATLLIVGEWDEVVIKLNQQAFQQLHCVKKMVIVPGATHLFEEPGKIEIVAKWTIDWFKEYLV